MASTTTLRDGIDATLRIRHHQPLDELVTTARTAGHGWRTIARQIHKATGLRVSHETLRGWYPDVRGTLDPLRQRIDTALRTREQRTLDHLVAEARAAGYSWRSVAHLVERASGLPVSYGALVAWYSPERAQGQQT